MYYDRNAHHKSRKFNKGDSVVYRYENRWKPAIVVSNYDSSRSVVCLEGPQTTARGPNRAIIDENLRVKRRNLIDVKHQKISPILFKLMMMKTDKEWLQQ